MGKVRGKDLKPRRGGGGGGGSKSRTGGEKDNILGKISADIGAISLGPPRTKILKKSGGGSSSSASSSCNFSANFASRIMNSNSPQGKQKKKVTFCQNLIAEELKEGRGEGEEGNRHQYFSKRTFHPSQVSRKRKLGGEGSLKMKARVASAVPDNEVLLSSSANLLRKIIKKGVKNKKIRLKAKKQSFQKKMELIKANKEELLKAKQRQQTVIVGDIHPMLESLPSIEEDTEEDKLQTESASKLGDGEGKNIPKKTQKFSVKKTQKAILDSLKFFEAAGVGKTAAGLSAN